MTQLVRFAGPLLVVVALGVGLVAAVAVLTRRRRWLLSLCCVMYALALVALLLRPTLGLSATALSLVPLADIGPAITSAASAQVPLVQLLGNVLLFVPFGLLAPARVPALRSLPRTGVAAGVAATAIEALQFVLATGRVASLDDVLLNVVGASLGFGMWRLSEALDAAAQTRREQLAESG